LKSFFARVCFGAGEAEVGFISEVERRLVVEAEEKEVFGEDIAKAWMALLWWWLSRVMFEWWTVVRLLEMRWVILW
jgi:hypothetical protein